MKHKNSKVVNQAKAKQLNKMCQQGRGKWQTNKQTNKKKRREPLQLADKVQASGKASQMAGGRQVAANKEMPSVESGGGRAKKLPALPVKSNIVQQYVPAVDWRIQLQPGEMCRAGRRQRKVPWRGNGQCIRWCVDGKHL